MFEGSPGAGKRKALRILGSSCAFPGWAGWMGLGLALVASSCAHYERAQPAREPEALSPEVVRPYRPNQPGFDLVLTPGDEATCCVESYRFEFSTFSDFDGDFKRVTGELYRSRRVHGGGRAPLIILAPILAGAADNYLACRVFARWACQEGMSAYFLHQNENVLSADRDGVELERLIADNVRDNIKALDLFLERPDIDPTRLGSLGISMGAIKNVVLAAVEPRLKANVFCLGGADLPRIFLLSQERGVLRYIRRREARDSMDRAEICAEIERTFRAEPARFAPFIPNDRSLVVIGSFDDKVPYETGLLLKQKLGDPETYVIPLGHYTGIVAAPFAARKMFGYFRRQLSMPLAD